MKGLKIGIVVAGFIAAALIFWRYGSGETAPDTPETKTSWKCSVAECGHLFEMTAKQRDEARAKGPQPWPPAICPKCDKQTAFLCQKCPTCGTIYFGTEVPGSTGVCPKCHPEIKPPEPEPELPPVEEGQEPPRPRPKAL